MEFIDERIIDLGNSLSNAEKEIQNFKLNNNYVDPENLEMDVLAKLKSYEKEYLEMNFEKSALLFLKEYINENEDIVYVPPFVLNYINASIQNILNQLIGDVLTYHDIDLILVIFVMLF